MLEKPIFLIGTHRSGTTWLGGLLGQLKQVAYWSEPRQVWSYGNWFLPDDVLAAEHARPAVKRYIRRRFERFTQRQRAQRFCEKTPSNCLRIPFVHEIFPEGRFVLLLRDGRAVFRSTVEMQQKSADWSRIWQRIRESSWRELPAYRDRIGWVFQKLRGQPFEFWGVRPRGWKQWQQQLTRNQLIAIQWAESISYALDSWEDLPPDGQFKIRYEDILSSPNETLTQLAAFLELSQADQLIRAARGTAESRSADKWTAELSEPLLEEIRPIMEDTLNRIGYQWGN